MSDLSLKVDEVITLFKANTEEIEKETKSLETARRVARSAQQKAVDSLKDLDARESRLDSLEKKLGAKESSLAEREERIKITENRLVEAKEILEKASIVRKEIKEQEKQFAQKEKELSLRDSVSQGLQRDLKELVESNTLKKKALDDLDKKLEKERQRLQNIATRYQ